MSTRMRKPKVISSEHSWLLHSGDVAVQGEACGFDTASGDIRPMSAITTLIFMGFFAESMTGDGTLKVRVNLPNEVEAEWLANDAGPNDCSGASRGSEVYYKDSKTVSTLATSRSKAGRVLDYDADSNLVLVQGGTAVTGPTGTGGLSRSVATRAALTAIAAASRNDGDTVMVRTDGSNWRFIAGSSAVVDGAGELCLAPDAGTGRWFRNDKSFVMKLPIGFGLADAAVLATIPTGLTIRLTGMPWWDIVTGFAGGSSSAIGIYASAIATAKGDLLGGAGGDVAATLVAGSIPGTIGPKIDTFAEVQAFLLKAADTILFGRITSVFTSGAGFVCIPIAVELVG